MKKTLIAVAGWVVLNYLVAALDLIPAEVGVVIGVSLVLSMVAGLVYLMFKLPTIIEGKN